MNKIAFSFALVAIFALIARGADDEPKMPRRQVCSIQGKGRVIHKFHTETYKGTFFMYRVNGAAIYNFTAFNDDAKEIQGYLIIRPDLKQSDYDVGDHGVYAPIAYPLTEYKYADDFKPVADMDYYCFKYGFHTAAMLFSRDKDMNLIGEWYNWGDDQDPESLTFLYDEVKEFEHNEVDGLFSLKGNPKSDFYKDASTALTSKCDEGSSSAAVVTPVLVAVFATVVLSIVL